jgi:hypothetical protein
MTPPFRLHQNSTVASEEILRRYVGQPFPTADCILLCCFGTDPDGERTDAQLRQALIQTGFPGSLSRYLINVSSVIYRSAKGRYSIKRFET